MKFPPLVAWAVLSTSPFIYGQGDGSFQSPLTLRAEGPGPVSVQAGDFNHDGKLDLTTTNGTGAISVFFQDPSSPLVWKQISITIGLSSVFSRASDLDGDGVDDLVVADPSTTVYFSRSRGDMSFEMPAPVDGSRGGRWIAIGDWNGDGDLDLASANFGLNTVTTFSGDGKGRLALNQTVPVFRAHSVEALDFDGDGKKDLVVGNHLPGFVPCRGNGDGTFLPLEPVSALGCVEYIGVGDLNSDGKDDIATTCAQDGTASAGISLGDGSFTRTLGPFPAGSGTDSVAIGDLDGDRHGDVAVVSNGSASLWVFPGKGDGRFLPPSTFGPTGKGPVFLLARDLDGDGHTEVVSADELSSTVTIFRGTKGGRFLEAGYTVSGFSGTKVMAVADLDQDGAPDLLFPSSSLPAVSVYLKPGRTSPTSPSFIINTGNSFTSLEMVDLDADGIPDLVGSNQTSGTALVALLGADYRVRSEIAMPAGTLAGRVRVGRIDGGETLDLAVPCSGDDSVSLFFGQGSGAFASAQRISTIAKPKVLSLGDLDGDGRADVAVIGAGGVIGVHYGLGAGDLGQPVLVLEDAKRNLSDVAAADMDSDGVPDLIVPDGKEGSVLILKGRGTRGFDAPESLKVSPFPVMVVLADLDGDGFLDISTSHSMSQSMTLLLNRGHGFDHPVIYGVGFNALGHRVVDLDQDGALDLVAFSALAGTILPGRPLIRREFRRGDTDGDGTLDLTDAILVLQLLFLAGDPVRCQDAADANDDGSLDLSDPIAVLNALFQGGGPLPPPGPGSCGADPTHDSLGCTSGC